MKKVFLLLVLSCASSMIVLAQNQKSLAMETSGMTKDGKVIHITNVHVPPPYGNHKFTVICEIPADSLMKLNIIDFCNLLNIRSTFNDRYAMIDALRKGGKNIIPASTNPFCDGKHKDEDRVWYIGTDQQDDILKRNIIKNFFFMFDGHTHRAVMDKAAVLNWRVVK